MIPPALPIVPAAVPATTSAAASTVEIMRASKRVEAAWLPGPGDRPGERDLCAGRCGRARRDGCRLDRDPCRGRHAGCGTYCGGWALRPHRDEPYFVAAGGHHALGYPDQPLLTPLLAWSVNAVDHGSLLILRAPASLAGAVSTVTTGLLARELLDNREQGVPVRLCTGLRHPWPRMWHALRHYD